MSGDTIVAIILGAAVVILSIALILTIRSLANVSPSLVAYGKSAVEAIKNQALVEDERDDWKARAVNKEIELNSAKKQLASIQSRLQDFIDKKAADHVEEIRSAPTPTAALDQFNRLLQEVPRVSAIGSASKASG